MKILITDDEVLARARMNSLLQEVAGAEVVGEAENGKECLLLSDQLKPDVVLLDIRMPGIDGLEAAVHLARYEKPPAVIFTTAYSDHALAAFEANAVDYLLKPIRKERLVQALHKARTPNRAQISAIRAHDTGAAAARTHVCVRFRDAVQLIPVAEIIYFRADQKYVTLRHRGGDALLEDSLTSLAQEFAETFVRIHRNTLISTAFFQGIERDGDGRYHALLSHCEDRPEISRRHVRELKARMKEFRR
jgi:two-component system response regulator AlgR